VEVFLLSLLYRFVLALFLLASLVAHAGWEMTQCILWSAPTAGGGFGSPGAAALRAFEVSMGSGCTPKVNSCMPNPSNSTADFTCTVDSTPIATCPQGFVVATTAHGSQRTMDGLHCGVMIPDPGKGNGPPDCPNCQSQGNPVNMGTGNKYQREVDFDFPNGLSLVRYYNARSAGYARRMGRNWMHNWAKRLEIVTAGTITAARSDGRFIDFTQSGSNWLGPVDMPERLVAVTGGYQLTNAEDEVEAYDAIGQLVSVTSRSGLVTTLTYADGTTGPNGALADGSTTVPVPEGSLLKVQDAFGRSIQFSYDRYGKTVKVTDPQGQIYRYTYDLQPNLATVQYPDTKTRTYFYNESTYTSGASLPYHLTGIQDENGNRFATFQYFSDGRAKSSSHAGGVDNFSFTYGTGTVNYTDAKGTTRTATFSTIQDVNQLTGITQTCTGCGGTTSASYGYDTYRNITSYKDFNGNLTCFTFDTSRRL
jgi:YD repeat-containing protein